MTENTPAGSVTVHLEPDGETLVFPRLNTVLQLLNRLGIGLNDALVIRSNELLTQDRRVHTGDCITLRRVTSRG